MANLVRREPFHDLVSLRDAMDRLFEDSFVRGGWGLAPFEAGALAVDMYETEDAVVVKSALPGVKPDDVDVSVVGNVVTIKGESKAEEEVKEEHYIRRDMHYGSFSRSVQLPVDVQADKAEAEFKDGVLVLTLPKAKEHKPKVITVKAK